MDDIQPYGYGEDAGLMIPLGGTVTRSKLDRIIRTVIVITCSTTLAILRISERRI
jgi:hypothetical protein